MPATLLGVWRRSLHASYTPRMCGMAWVGYETPFLAISYAVNVLSLVQVTARRRRPLERRWGYVLAHPLPGCMLLLRESGLLPVALCQRASRLGVTLQAAWRLGCGVLRPAHPAHAIVQSDGARQHGGHNHQRP